MLFASIEKWFEFFEFIGNAYKRQSLVWTACTILEGRSTYKNMVNLWSGWTERRHTWCLHLFVPFKVEFFSSLCRAVTDRRQAAPLTWHSSCDRLVYRHLLSGLLCHSGLCEMGQSFQRPMYFETLVSCSAALEPMDNVNVAKSSCREAFKFA